MRHARRLLPALLILLAACSAGPTGSGAGQEATSGDVDAFVAALQRDIDFDYDPLASPADAIKRADLIVVGRTTGISEGVAISSPEGLWNQMTTFTVVVDDVIAGDSAAASSGEIVLQVFRSPLTPIEELQAARPDGQAVFILDDITKWSPFTEAKFEYPDGLGTGSRLFTPFNDGMWFDGGATVHGAMVEPGELAKGWGEVGNLQQLIDALKVAARTQD